MAIYMFIKGTPGNVSAKGHENWIALETCAFAVNRHISVNTGVTAGRLPSLPAFTDIEISKPVDSSSNNLLTFALHGSTLPEVVIDCCHTQSSLQPYLQYKLSDVIITHRMVSVDADFPQETLTLNFTQIEENFIASNADQQAQAPLRVAYDLSTAEVC